MKITFENPDKINGLMTITIEEADFKDSVAKQLKDYAKKANIAGFRPGQVPVGMIQRQYGASIKADVINNLLGKALNDYIKENNINMLGNPLPNENQKPVELEKDAPYTFVFDIAVAPEFKAELTGRDKVPYYEINVDDEMIDSQVNMFASRAGNYEKVDAYEENDMLKGELQQLDKNGTPMEGGIKVEAAIMMPHYIKVDKQRKLFAKAKVGDVITFNPRKAYPENDTELAGLLKIDREIAKDVVSDFSYKIAEITRFKKHEVNQELFDQVYGNGTVKNEKQFREMIAGGLKGQLQIDSDFRFLQDVRKHMEKKVGKLVYPDALMKRIMLSNNKDKDEKFVEENYEGSIKELTWRLIKGRLVEAQKIKIEDSDVKEAAKEAARMQFAQYGMSNVPEEYLANYASEMLKKQENVDGLIDRAIDVKLTTALKAVVKLNTQTVSMEEFNKLAR